MARVERDSMARVEREYILSLYPRLRTTAFVTMARVARVERVWLLRIEVLSMYEVD